MDLFENIKGRMTKRVCINTPDELDILSAVWILSCNDENPIITYEGIKHRLDLSPDFKIEELIHCRGELFRRKIPTRPLEVWKQEMREGKHIPSWIADIENETERQEKIDSITVHDGFRNQFRAKMSAPQVSIDVIKWGLEHIERLRKAGAEAREEKVKKITGIIVPIASMSIAFFAMFISAYLQYRSINTQIELKKYETSFKPKQEGYALFMDSVAKSYDSAYKGMPFEQELPNNLDKIEIAYYTLEPFLSEEARNAIWEQYLQYSVMCLELREEPAKSPDIERYNKSYIQYKSYFRENLYKALFADEPTKRY